MLRRVLMIQNQYRQASIFAIVTLLAYGLLATLKSSDIAYAFLIYLPTSSLFLLSLTLPIFGVALMLHHVLAIQSQYPQASAFFQEYAIVSLLWYSLVLVLEPAALGFWWAHATPFILSSIKMLYSEATSQLRTSLASILLFTMSVLANNINSLLGFWPSPITLTASLYCAYLQLSWLLCLYTSSKITGDVITGYRDNLIWDATIWCRRLIKSSITITSVVFLVFHHSTTLLPLGICLAISAIWVGNIFWQTGSLELTELIRHDRYNLAMLYVWLFPNLANREQNDSENYCSKLLTAEQRHNQKKFIDHSADIPLGIRNYYNNNLFSEINKKIHHIYNGKIQIQYQAYFDALKSSEGRNKKHAIEQLHGMLEDREKLVRIQAGDYIDKLDKLVETRDPRNLNTWQPLIHSRCTHDQDQYWQTIDINNLAHPTANYPGAT